MKNRTETDIYTKRVKKYYRSRISCHRETVFLQLMSGSGTVPTLYQAGRLYAEMEYVQGMALSQVLSCRNTQYICAAISRTLEWLEKLQTAFYAITAGYVVLDDINPANLIYNDTSNSVTGIDFESWHTGKKEENILSLLAMVKTARYHSKEVENTVYSFALEKAAEYLGTDSETTDETVCCMARLVQQRRRTMKLVRRCDGAILAGGKSSRMGSHKGLLSAGDFTFTDHIIYAMNIFDRLTISADIEEYASYGLPLTVDIYKDCGPLGALHALLSASGSQWVFTVPCDMPFITTETILSLFSRADYRWDCVAFRGDRVYPTVALYNRRILPQVEKQLESGNFRLMSLLDSINTQYVWMSSREEFANINTPEEYESTKDCFINS